MLTLLTILGIVFFVVMVLILMFRSKLGEKTDIEREYGDIKKINSIGVPKFLLFFKKGKGLVIGFVLSIMLLTSHGWMFWAEPGYQYFLVYPWGTKDAVMSQGYTFRGFAAITAWQKYIDVAAPTPTDIETGKVSMDELEGKMNPVPIRFIDQVTADMYPALRFQIPPDEQDFINFAIKYRTMENLVYNTLIPAIKEQCTNTGYMFTAQDYISGSSQEFRQIFEEMITDGAYKVEKTTKYDTTYFGDIQTPEAPREIRDVSVLYQVEKVIDPKTGLPARVPHEITKNKLLVSQVIVADVDLDADYKGRLKDQKAESAKRQLEQQKIETAKLSQQRIAAEGERDKTQERVDQEKEQVKQLIAIETKLKQEKTNKELAAIALETERLRASAKKVSADAQFYENAKLVQAGLTPQERAEWDYKTSVGVAAELAKWVPPSVYFNGSGDGGNGSILTDLLAADLAKVMKQTQINKTK